MLAEISQSDRCVPTERRRAAIELCALSSAPDVRTLTPTECRHVAAALGKRSDLWRDLVAVDFEERWSERIFDGVNYDVWILAWQTAQGTDWHDHGGSAGGYFVAEGTLREFFRHGDCPAPISQLREAGSGMSFGSRHIHDMQHAGEATAVSVHVYSPPIAEMTFYDLTPTGFTARETTLVEPPRLRAVGVAVAPSTGMQEAGSPR